MDFLRRAGSKINDWLKSTKIVSTVGPSLVRYLPPAWQGAAEKAIDFAKSRGYGRRRRYGRGIGLAGSGLRLAGATYY